MGVFQLVVKDLLKLVTRGLEMSKVLPAKDKINSLQLFHRPIELMIGNGLIKGAPMVASERGA